MKLTSSMHGPSRLFASSLLGMALGGAIVGLIIGLTSAAARGGTARRPDGTEVEVSQAALSASLPLAMTCGAISASAAVAFWALSRRRPQTKHRHVLLRGVALAIPGSAAVFALSAAVLSAVGQGEIDWAP